MRTAALPCALSALIASCTASGEDVRPPDDQLFFPSGMAIAQGKLFVANSNSELRYDSGAIHVIDLAVVEETIAAWAGGTGDRGDCEPDPERRETLICDEAKFINENAGVRIGNFATDIAVQDFTGTSGEVDLRVIVPTRGDPSITWADFDGTRLSCASGSGAFLVCDAAHRLSSVRDLGEDAPIHEEPFGVFADAANGYAIVTHLGTPLSPAAITLVDAPRDGTVQISDALVNVFLGAGNIVGGATGVVGRASTAPTIEEPRPGADIVYIGSSTENRVQTFTVGRPVNDPAPYLLPGNFFLLDGIDVNYGNSTETRGMQFSKDGNRLYVVNRRPPSLSIFDTSLGPTQVPRNVQTGSTDICRQASTVAVLGFGENGQEDAVEGERAYVTCFQDGELYVVDPRGQSQVEDVLTVGRGPYSVVAVDAVGAPRRLFISNFLEDTIAVVDVDPQSPSRNRVVLRIGEPKSLESL